jgi:hypothetical protein
LQRRVRTVKPPMAKDPVQLLDEEDNFAPRFEQVSAHKNLPSVIGHAYAIGRSVILTTIVGRRILITRSGMTGTRRDLQTLRQGEHFMKV